MTIFGDYVPDMSKQAKFSYFFSGIIFGIILAGLLGTILVFRMPRYEVSSYEGMTCINHQNGLTCNWDEWKGDPK